MQRACLASSAARSSQWFGRAGAAGREDDGRRGVGIRPPSRVDGEGTPARPRPQPEADEFAAEQERIASAALIGRPIALGDERAVRDADGRELEHGAELECEACSARMVAAGRVDQQYVRRLRQRANRGFQECALAEPEQARLVRCARMTWHHRRASIDPRGCPRRIARLARAPFPAGEADEDAADLGLQLESPPLRPKRSQPQLLLDQLLARQRPGKHRRILASMDALVAAARAAGVKDESVLAAIASVPRWEFVPAEHAGLANVDTPLPIPHEQVTTQPSLIARMVEALALSGTERVLEVGTGYGWQTALLAELAREVFSVERFADLADSARAALTGRGNAHVFVGDGTQGLPKHAPFDAILVAAAYPEVPNPLAEQLAEGGRLVQPLGFGGAEDVVLFEKGGDALDRVLSVSGACFVRLHGRHGFP